MNKVVVIMEAEMKDEMLQLDPDTAGEYYTQLVKVEKHLIKEGYQDVWTWEEHVHTMVQLGILMGKLESCQLSVQDLAVVLALSQMVE